MPLSMGDADYDIEEMGIFRNPSMAVYCYNSLWMGTTAFLACGRFSLIYSIPPTYSCDFFLKFLEVLAGGIFSWVEGT